jgi:D-xylose transport system permease protein
VQGAIAIINGPTGGLEMADVTAAAPKRAGARARGSIGDLVAQTEVDLRLFGMLVALIAILLGFHVLSDYTMLTPGNMATLAIQASSVAIMATGMTLIIVSRNIDLSVGSLAGIVAMIYAMSMTTVLPSLGIGVDNQFMWVIALAIGLGAGALIGALQGFIIAYIGVPSFIVTLGGLLAFRGAIWLLSKGAAVPVPDATFKLIGGGAQGSLGGTATWAIGVVGGIAIIGLLAYNRRQRRRFGFALRPMWAEVLLGVVGSLAVLGVAAYANGNPWPRGLALRYAQQHGIPVPEGGLFISTGFPWPVVLVIGVTTVMWFIATRRRFGRYVYAYGGNPEAAELAGINTRWTVMRLFILMGLLCGVAAAIYAARLNLATLDIGQSDELYVIAACVVGGVSFAGGVGSIPGAVLGAFVMASLAYGLAFNGVNSPTQNVIAGIVLIIAVGFDSWNRRRGGRR